MKHEPVSVWDVRIADNGFACYAAMLVPINSFFLNLNTSTLFLILWCSAPQKGCFMNSSSIVTLFRSAKSLALFLTPESKIRVLASSSIMCMQLKTEKCCYDGNYRNDSPIGTKRLPYCWLI